MYFQLCGECYLVRGEKGGVIYHLLQKEAVCLEEEEVRLLLDTENGKPCGNGPLLDELEKMGWGFYSQERVYVDKLRPYNSFLLVRKELKPPVLQTAFLQLTADCGCGAEHCKERFCSPCRASDVHRAELTVEQWKGILSRLSQAGAGGVLLTGGDLSRYAGLGELAGYCVTLGLSCCVVLNHYQEEAVRRIPESVGIIVYVCSEQTEKDCRKIREQRPDATVLFHEGSASFPERNPPAAGGRMIAVSAGRPKLGKRSVKPCGYQEFYSKKDRNHCLNGKMYILAGGEVVPCYQKTEQVIGNLINERFGGVYRRLVEECWDRPVRHEKCRKCSWYYGCSVCMCMEPETQCSYDTGTQTWKEDEQSL